MEDGKTVARPETDPARNGYDFGGWYSGKDEYDFSAAVTADLTLTAKWTAHVYTITYKLNGGTNHADNPATYTIDTDDITLKDPTAPADKPNFGGWFKDAEYKTQVTKIARGTTGDLTLYAYFSEKAIVKHSVKVVCNGTEVPYPDGVIDGNTLSEEAMRTAANGAVTEGYELEGFYSDAAFTAKFDFSKAITADTVIYAKITARTFTVSFEGLEAKQTVEYGKTATEPADKPTKDGYTFNGWDFDFSTAIKADTTVKAKWVVVSYKYEINKTVEPSKAYDTSVVLLSDYIPATVSLSDFAYIKLSCSFYDADSKEIVFDYDAGDLTGQVTVLGEGDWNSLYQLANIVPSGNSQYDNTYIKIVDGIQKIAVQNSGTNCKKFTVNSMELIKLESGTASDTLENAVKDVRDNSKGETLVIAYVMTAEGKGNWGIGGLIDSSWSVVKEISAPAEYELGAIIEAEIAKADISAEASGSINLYNGAVYQYAYIK